MLNALYYSNGVAIPLSFEIIEKYQYSDIETREVKRKAVKTKNELMREMILTAVKNQVKFRYVLMDSWFGAKENFKFITKHKKEFISAIKSNQFEIFRNVIERNSFF
jgi:SRSO17 transposase